MLFLIILFNILNLYDYISTMVLLQDKRIYEANPLVDWLIKHKLFLIVKIILSIVISVIFTIISSISCSCWILLIAVIALGIACVNNTRNWIIIRRER